MQAGEGRRQVSTSLLSFGKPGPRKCRGYANRFGTAVPCWREADGCDQCVTCAGIEEREQRAKRAASDRRVARQMAQGFGPAKDGEDVFRGLLPVHKHGGDCDCMTCRPWTY
jgi:hypothetical protein